jgi:hypothetical protein
MPAPAGGSLPSVWLPRFSSERGVAQGHARVPEVRQMKMNRLALAGGAVALTALLAEMTLGGTTPLNAGSSKRRVKGNVDTQTSLVAQPVVEKKIEASNTWVVEPAESTQTEVAKIVEEPVRPVLPAFTAFTIFDCNLNDISDATEIENGAADSDADGVLDSCEYAIGDLNLNGVVDGQDVSILLGWWGVDNPLVGDLDGDGQVNAFDLGIMLGRFGVVVY